MTYAIPISAYGEVNPLREITFTHAEFIGVSGHEALSFMETFSFPDLKGIKSSLKKAKYSTEEVNEIILGLKTLPEYKRG